MNAQTQPASAPAAPAPAPARALRAISLLAVVLAALALSCSLAVDFDPEGKPCGGAERACLEGYHCNAENKCVEGEAEPEPAADAGTDAGA